MDSKLWLSSINLVDAAAEWLDPHWNIRSMFFWRGERVGLNFQCLATWLCALEWMAFTSADKDSKNMATFEKCH